MKWVLHLGLAALLPSLLAGCEREVSAPEPAPIRAVKIQVAEANSAVGSRSFSGELAPIESIRLSFAVSGQLIDVPLREGQSFEAEAVVARLEERDISREVTAAEARLSAARSRLTETENNYARQRSLAERGVIAAAMLDKSITERAGARADLDVARTDLQVAQDRLAKTRLIAPRSGVVTGLLARQFEEIAAGTPVYEVSTGDGLQAEVLVPEQLVTGLAVGTEVAVRIPGLADLIVGGRIDEIAAEADSGNAFRVKARLGDIPAGARIGMTAVVALTLGTGEGPLFDLPLAALAFDRVASQPQAGAIGKVFVLDEPAQRVSRREVRIARLLGNRVLVAEGLASGDQVVVAGVAFLTDGMAARRWTAPE